MRFGVNNLKTFKRWPYFIARLDALQRHKIYTFIPTITLHKHTGCTSRSLNHTDIVIGGCTRCNKVTLGISVSSGVEYLDWKLRSVPHQTMPRTKQLSTGFGGFADIFIHSHICRQKSEVCWLRTNWRRDQQCIAIVYLMTLNVVIDVNKTREKNKAQKSKRKNAFSFLFLIWKV